MRRRGRGKSPFGNSQPVNPEDILKHKDKEIEQEAEKKAEEILNQKGETDKSADTPSDDTPKLDRDALAAEYKEKIDQLNELLEKNAESKTIINAKRAAYEAAGAKTQAEKARLEHELKQKTHEQLTGFVKELEDVKVALGDIVSDLQSLDNASEIQGFIQGLSMTGNGLESILNQGKDATAPQAIEPSTQNIETTVDSVSVDLRDAGDVENMDAVVLTTEIKNLDQDIKAAQSVSETNAQKVAQLEKLIGGLNIERDLDMLRTEYGQKEKMILKKVAKKTIQTVADNLERSAKVLPQQQDKLGTIFNSVAERLQKAETELQDAFKKYGIEKVETKIGSISDPSIHEQIAGVPMPGKEDGEILDVTENGYTLNGASLRTPKVVVANNS